jgi:ABC-type nitrate/sulfonate/bicarbonate transport system permease component
MPVDDLTPIAFRGRGFAPVMSRTGGAAALIGIIALWQAASSLLHVSPLFLPSPLAIATSLYDLVVHGDLVSQIAVSAARIAAGWTLGAAAGLIVGLAMGLWSFARSAGFAIVSALFPIPKIALLPLMILWFGIGEPSKVATIALGVFFPTTIAAASGVDSVPRNLIRMAQSFGLPFGDIVRKVVLPGALPSILSGVRISASIALLLVVSAEMIGAEKGIGAFVLQAGNLMRTDQLLAGVLVLSLFGLVIARGIGALEKRLIGWR